MSDIELFSDDADDDLVFAGPDGEPFTTSLVIAQETGNQHKNVIELIRANLADFEEYGLVAFETRPRSEGQHGGGDVTYAILNEPQATLLITYMRNGGVVREVKKRLVRAFTAMKKMLAAGPAQPALPDISTPEGVAVMAAMFSDTAQKLVAVTNEKKCLEAAIERDAHLVAKAEAHTVSESVIHRQEFAREVITWGRKQNVTIRQEHVMRFLGHIGLFIRGERTDTGHATAEAIKRGLAFTDKGTAKNGHNWATGKLTARGQDYAWKRIAKYVEANHTLELPRELRGGDPA